MFIESKRAVLNKVRPVNQTGSFPSRINTRTEPVSVADSAGTATTQHVIENNPKGLSVAGSIYLWPYAIGSDDNTFLMRVIGWYPLGENAPATMLWKPVLLADFTCTCSTSVGIAGAVQLDTERDADTIAIIDGNPNISCEIISPEGNLAAHVMVSLKGCSKVEVTFDTNSSATSMNAWYSLR